MLLPLMLIGPLKNRVSYLKAHISGQSDLEQESEYPCTYPSKKRMPRFRRHQRLKKKKQ